MKEKDNFYNRMQDAKRKKKVMLEQQRIRAEFGEPVIPPDPIPSQTDEALDRIRLDLISQPSPNVEAQARIQNRLAQQIQRLQQKSEEF